MSNQMNLVFLLFNGLYKLCATVFSYSNKDILKKRSVFWQFYGKSRLWNLAKRAQLFFDKKKYDFAFKIA